MPGDVDIVTLVATDEQAINRMQMDIDQQCSQIIAKRQPAAIDLRMILTVVKIVNATRAWYERGAAVRRTEIKNSLE